MFERLNRNVKDHQALIGVGLTAAFFGGSVYLNYKLGSRRLAMSQTNLDLSLEKYVEYLEAATADSAKIALAVCEKLGK